MRNNQIRFTAAILLAVFLLTFFMAAGHRFFRPAAVPATGKSVVRLNRDNGETRREPKRFFRRKQKDKLDKLAEELANENKTDMLDDARPRGENHGDYNNRGGKCPNNTKQYKENAQ